MFAFQKKTAINNYPSLKIQDVQVLGFKPWLEASPLGYLQWYLHAVLDY